MEDMETIRIPNSATYSPVSLTDLMFAAPLASRLLIGATLPGRLVQAAAAGVYAGSVISDWASRRGVRKIDFLANFGADVKHLDEMPSARREEDVLRFSEELMGIYEPVTRRREVLAGDVNERLTSYIAGITGQRVETSSSVRRVTLARVIMPFASGSCDVLSGDIAVFRHTGVFEPHILAHEFCHRKGYLMELEAQALGYLALSRSRDPQLRQAALAERVVAQIGEAYLEEGGSMELLGRRVGADLLEYRHGELVGGSVDELIELGLYEGWVDPAIYDDLVSGQRLRASKVENLGGWQ